MTLAQVTLQRQLRTAVSASGFDLAPKWGFSTAPLSLISSDFLEAARNRVLSAVLPGE